MDERRQLLLHAIGDDDASDDSDDGESAVTALDTRTEPSQELYEQLLHEATPEQLLELVHSADSEHASDDDDHGDHPGVSGSVEHLQSHTSEPADHNNANADDNTLPFIADDVPTHGPFAHEDIEQVLERAPFGFTQVELEVSHSTAKRSSLVVLKSLANDVAAYQRSAQHASAAQRRAIRIQCVQLLADALRALLTLAALLEALYVLVSVPLRIGFHFDPFADAFDRSSGVWTRELTIYSALDVAGELVRLAYVYVERAHIGAALGSTKSATSQLTMRSGKSTRSSIGRRATRTVMPQLANMHVAPRTRLSVPTTSLFSVRNDGAMTVPIETASVVDDAHKPRHVPLLLKVLLVLHLDVAAALCLHCTWIHVARAVKLAFAAYSVPLLTAAVAQRCRQLEVVRLLSFSTLHLPFQLFWLGLYLCHVSACGYMLIAHIECGVDFARCSRSPVPGCWVIKDRLERGSFTRQYVRTMYWASKTITTLGQGDLVPTTQLETDYCIVVQFISGLWATAFLSSCSFYFSRRDADVNDSASTRLEQALKFLRNRRVPSELAAHIRAYHQYLQRTRNGIEETRILADLPTHYHIQCSSYVTMRLLRQVPFFSKQPKAFMKTVLALIESDFLSPNQTIIGVLDLEELLVVARGEIRVLDVEHRAVVETIETGMWYAEHALFQDQLSRYELVAGSFCEVYCLSRQSFSAAMEKHFPRFKIVLLEAQHMQHGHMPGVNVTANERLRRSESVDRRHTHLTSVSKSSHAAEAAAAVPWRYPTSRFRHVWRHWKAALTIYLAIEVPFDMAFDWRFGALGSATYTWRQYAAYVVMLIVEIFFYVDVYLRAREFARPWPATAPRDNTSPPHQLHDAGAITTVTTAAPRRRQSIRSIHHGLIVDRAELLQYYLRHGEVLLDAVATLPIAMVWSALPKEAVAFDTMYYMRFFRALALVRLGKLKKLLRKLMQDRNWSPASQLLANVIVFCVVTANAVACVFFLLADVDGSDSGVPRGFRGFGTVSAGTCLEHASVYGNCTWFVYDLSTFDIHARYLRSLHWSVVLLSTVGYGDILLFSDSECVVGFWWIFLGALTCYFTACAVSSVVAQVTTLDTERTHRGETVNRALVHTGVSSATYRIVRRHFETNWALNGSVVNERALRQHLPRSQRHELACALYVADIAQCYLFAGFRDHSSFVRDLALVLRSEVFVPYVVLLNCGHLADEMYLIQSGDVEVLIPRVETRARRYQSNLVTMSEYLSTQQQLDGSLTRHRTTLMHRIFRRASFGSSSDRYASAAAQQRMRRGIWEHEGGAASSKLVPIAVLRRGQCFGEESLLPNERYESRTSVRTVASTQVAVLTRSDALALLARYPDEAAAIVDRVLARRMRAADLFGRMNANFSARDKLKGFLGPTASSLYETTTVHASAIRGPDTLFYKTWVSVQGVLLLYNFFQIPFRIAFLPTPAPTTMRWLTAVDYSIDVLLLADIYVKWHRLGFTLYGDKIVDLAAIRARYRATWFRLDVLSLAPLYYVGADTFAMTLCRVPRLLRTPQLVEYVSELEEHLRKRIRRSSNLALLSVFELVKFLVLFLAAAHQIGSVYYTIGRLMVEHELAPASWITADAVLTAYPDNVAVHYVRAMYWCLGTFTVVCFGDVVARNAVETVYSGCACVIGWMCIGQIMGKITSLMAVMDQDQHEHNERVEAFEQYAKTKRLPSFLRERSIEALEFKSTCLIDLTMAETFRDLPKTFHVLLFDELYGDAVRNVPELRDALDEPQLQALANALRLELYLPADVIIEEGRVGSKLFILRDGAAELFSAHSQMIFAAVHAGVLFGDLAFFLPGTEHLVSVRASRSCQVLAIHRRDWLLLWSDATRAAVERKLVPVMQAKYRSTARAFRNVFRNFELAKAGALSHRRVATAAESSVGAGAKASTAVKTVGNHAMHEESNEDVNSDDDDDDDGDNSDLGKQQQSLTPVSGFGSAYLPRSTRSAMNAPVKGSRHKLSVHLGLPVRFREPTLSSSLQSSAVAVTVGGVWRRHERNLEVLAVIKHQQQQRQQQQSESARDEVRAIARRVSIGLDGDTDALAHETIFEAVGGDSGGHSDSGDVQLPSRIANDCVASDAGAMVKRMTVGSGLDALHARPLQPERAPGAATAVTKRHSIQVVGRNLRQSLADMNVTPRELSAAATAIVTQKLFAHTSAVVSTPATSTPIPATVSTPATAESGLAIPESALATRHHLPAGVAAVPVVDDSDSAAERGGHSYTKHLEALRVRSRARTHHRDASSSDDRNPYDIWVEPPRPPAFCLENSRFRHSWNVLMLAICWYYTLVVPFRISFDFEFLTRTGNRDAIVSWFVLEYVLDALCVADFVLQRRFFTYISCGEVVTDGAQIGAHYWRDGSYVSDLVSILPLEALAPVYAAVRQHQGRPWAITWYRVAVFRTNKMVRIARLHDLSARVQRTLVYDWKWTFISPRAVYFVRFALDFALGAHWVACFFYSFSYNTFVEDGRASWLTAPGMLAYAGCEGITGIADVPVVAKFARAYHFSMGAITTVSYGDIAPLNAIETLLGTIVIVVSVVLFGMLAGGFFHLFEMELGQRADYEERVARVAAYMAFHGFHARIWKQLQVYFSVYWHESKGMDEDALLRGLTTSVRQDIVLFVKRDFVVQMTLFATCEEAFVRAVVTAFQQELYVRHDVIIAEGNVGRSLYVIENGSVLVRATKKAPRRTVVAAAAARVSKSNMNATNNNNNSSSSSSSMNSSSSAAAAGKDETLELVKGRFDFFGEKSLILDVPRSATCIALSSCSMLILTVETYRAILDDFPEYRERNMRDWLFANATQDAHAPLQHADATVAGAE